MTDFPTTLGLGATVYLCLTSHLGLVVFWSDLKIYESYLKIYESYLKIYESYLKIYESSRDTNSQFSFPA